MRGAGRVATARHVLRHWWLAGVGLLGAALSTVLVLTTSGAGPVMAGLPASTAPSPAPTRPASAAAAPPALAVPASGHPRRVVARGGELADAATGARLWSRDLNVSRPMGSITKVMTALVVLRAGDLSRKIKVSRAAIRYVHRDGASSAGLIAGDVLTARQLLEAMLLPSGCDAAFLLATSYGPGRKAFIAKMNATARQLGLAGTHFTSFDGMPFPTEHSTYSTPASLVALGEQAMHYQVFRAIVAQRQHDLAATRQHHRYEWHSTDHLLLARGYRGAIGIKTGSTKAAGECLLFEAQRGGRALIGVVLRSGPEGSPDLFTAARRLLNWGFRQPALPPAAAG
jgi:D-alanyl-D-alanine carboxypeptidase (penicillin-binding protein 5/6)